MGEATPGGSVSILLNRLKRGDDDAIARLWELWLGDEGWRGGMAIES